MTHRIVGAGIRVLKAYAISFLVWGALALALGYQSYFNNQSGTHPPTFWYMAALIAKRYLCFALLTPPVFALAAWCPLSTQRLKFNTFMALAGGAIFTLAFCVLRWALFSTYDPLHRIWLPRNWQALQGLITSNVFDVAFMYFSVYAVAQAWVFYGRNRKQQLEQAELRRSLAENQLQLLKMQLQPHFLFNTLQGIATLMSRDVPTAHTMLLRLSDLLRTAIHHQNRDVVTLEEELAFLDSYVQIERMRFGERLKFDVAVPNEARSCFVPHMILQPLVENAFIHGVGQSREGGWVRLDAARHNGRLELVVSNSLGAQPAPSQNRDGMGLRNTRARLESLYGGDASLSFAVENSQTAELKLTLPVVRGRAGGAGI